jgi:F0F1-type ATP synthase assembly protein I
MIRWQVSALGAATLLALFFAGWRGAASASLAALALIVPNLLFAARCPGSALLVTFFAGAIVRVIVTVALLAMVVNFWHSMDWYGFLLGVLLTAQANFLAFWKS